MIDIVIDPNRLNRIHVVNVRIKKDGYVIVLSDGSEFDWDVWNKLSEADRNYYKGI